MDEASLEYDETEATIWSDALFGDRVSALGLDLSAKLADAPDCDHRNKIRERFAALVDKHDDSMQSLGFIAHMIFSDGPFAQEFDAQVALSIGTTRARFDRLSMLYNQAIDHRKEREGRKCWAAQLNTVKIWGQDFTRVALELKWFDQNRHFWDQVRSAAGRVNAWGDAREMLNLCVFDGSANRRDWGAARAAGPQKLFRAADFHAIKAGAGRLVQVMIEHYGLMLDKNGMIDFSDEQQIGGSMIKRIGELQAPDTVSLENSQHAMQTSNSRQANGPQYDNGVVHLERNTIQDSQLQHQSSTGHNLRSTFAGNHASIASDAPTPNFILNLRPRLHHALGTGEMTKSTTVSPSSDPQHARRKRKSATVHDSRPTQRPKISKTRGQDKVVEEIAHDVLSGSGHGNAYDQHDMFCKEPSVDADPHYLLDRAYLSIRKALIEVNIDPDSEVETVEYSSQRDRLYHFALPLLCRETRPAPAQEWRPSQCGNNWTERSEDFLRTNADVWTLDDNEACMLMDSDVINIDTPCLIRGSTYTGRSNWFRTKLSRLPEEYEIAVQGGDADGPRTDSSVIASAITNVYDQPFNYERASDFEPTNCLDIHFSTQAMDPIFIQHPRFDLIGSLTERLHPRNSMSIGKPAQEPASKLLRPTDIEASTKFCALSSYLTFSRFHKDAYNCTWVKSNLSIPAFETRNAGGKGLSLSATRDIELGEHLIEEFPLFILPKQDTKNAAIVESFMHLRPEQRATYLNLSYHTTCTAKTQAEDVETSAAEDGVTRSPVVAESDSPVEETGLLAEQADRRSCASDVQPPTSSFDIENNCKPPNPASDGDPSLKESDKL
ncbi:hypothetical protein KCU73_g642, partial [Aureobasidium melanogenum]